MAIGEYDEYYDLIRILEADESIVPPRPIILKDIRVLQAEGLARLAQPLPDGTESPFSNQTPTSLQGLLLGELLLWVELFTHEINLIPNQTLETIYRMMGAYRSIAEYHVLELKFTRTQEAIANNIEVIIPINTQIQSRYNPEQYVVTMDELVIGGTDRTGLVSARFYVEGVLPTNTRLGAFSILPRNLRTYIESVTDTGVTIKRGRSVESSAELQTRARAKIQNPGDRLVVPRDYVNMAILDGGASKALPLRNILLGMGTDGEISDREYRDNVLTLVIYPTEPALISLVQSLITPKSVIRNCFVRPARVIPIDGNIECKVDPNLPEAQLFNLAATAIQDYIQPPNGTWGDRNFLTNLAVAIEKAQGIYAVPTLNLKHAVTGVPFSSLEIFPWDLLEIQESITFKWIRV